MTIEWAYLRKGWVSCKKAQKAFEQRGMALEQVPDVLDAKKEPMGEKEAWDLIKGMETVHIGKGKKVLTLAPGSETKADILKSALGRTGNLRAPAIKSGNTLFVGYNDTIYDTI